MGIADSVHLPIIIFGLQLSLIQPHPRVLGRQDAEAARKAKSRRWKTDKGPSCCKSKRAPPTKGAPSAKAPAKAGGGKGAPAKAAPANTPPTEEPLEEKNLMPCSICGRKFAEDRVAKHKEICAKTSAKDVKPFDV